VRLTNYEKDDLLKVASRLTNEAIRCEHDTAEAFIHGRWYDYQKYGRAATVLRDQAAVCNKAVSL
jgi:hypothetical protein